MQNSLPPIYDVGEVACWAKMKDEDYYARLKFIADQYKKVLDYLTEEENQYKLEIRGFDDLLAQAIRAKEGVVGFTHGLDDPTDVDEQRFLVFVTMNANKYEAASYFDKTCPNPIITGDCWVRSMSKLVLHEFTHAALRTKDHRYFFKSRALAKLEGAAFLTALKPYMENLLAAAGTNPFLGKDFEPCKSLDSEFYAYQYAHTADSYAIFAAYNDPRANQYVEVE
jgi:hypothetical protein